MNPMINDLRKKASDAIVGSTSLNAVTPVTLNNFIRHQIMRITCLYIAAAALCCLISGCATGPVVLTYTDQTFNPPVKGIQPTIKGSINGVSGYFVIDTGAMAPVLTQAAIEKCGITAVASEHMACGIGGSVPLMQADNVVAQLYNGLTVHWSTVAVVTLETPSSDSAELLLGILDYQTMAERGAVMDMRHKTITLKK